MEILRILSILLNYSHEIRTHTSAGIRPHACGSIASRGGARQPHSLRPAANSTLDVSPDRITIWFSEPMEAAFSEIQVLNATGARVDSQDSAVDANDLTIMSVSLPTLPDGTYTVAWRNLSTIDGHSLRGAFTFSVGVPISETSTAQTSDAPLLASAGEPYIRWIVLLSALALTGALTFELLVSGPVLTAAGTRSPLGRLRPRLRSRSQRLMWLALIVFLLASVAQLITQTAIAFDIEPAAAAGPPALELLQQTEWGRIWQYRAGLAVMVSALFLLPLIVRFRRNRRQELLVAVTLWLALIASLGILLTISMTSHAAATIGIARFALINDIVHLTAAAVWVGGLLQLIANTPAIHSRHIRVRPPQRPVPAHSPLLRRRRAQRHRPHRNRRVQRMGASNRLRRHANALRQRARREGRADSLAAACRRRQPDMGQA